MKAVLFGGFLLLVVGCSTTVKADPSISNEALQKCIYAIVQRIEGSNYGLSTDRLAACDEFRPPRPPGSSPYFAP